MARVTGDFQSEVIRAYKGVLDFYYWRGIGVVRSWPRKPVLPRSPAVQAAGQDWRDNSRAISALPLSLQEQTAEEVRDTAYTWKDAWTTTAYGHGLTWGEERPPNADVPRSEYAMIIDYFATLNVGVVTININSGSYIFRAGWTAWVPFASIPFTHYRIAGFGQSNAAGQNVSLDFGLDAAPFVPFHSPGPAITKNNTLDHFDSGWLSIDNIPASDQRCILSAKGSNSTVDLAIERLYVELCIL